MIKAGCVGLMLFQQRNLRQASGGQEPGENKAREQRREGFEVLQKHMKYDLTLWDYLGMESLLPHSPILVELGIKVESCNCENSSLIVLQISITDYRKAWITEWGPMTLLAAWLGDRGSENPKKPISEVTLLALHRVQEGWGEVTNSGGKLK